MSWSRLNFRRWRLIAALCLAPSRAIADPSAESSCPRAVQFEGAPQLVLALSQALSLRGIGSETPPGCPALVARVLQRGSLLALTVIEERRRSERTVADLGTAIAVIESFVRSDISAPLLAAPPFFAPPPDTAPRPVTRPVAVPAAPRFGIGLATEAAVDTDGRPWFGASLHACARLGPLCLGTLFRFASGLPMLRMDGLTDQRFASDFYVTADLPVRLSRFIILPGLGLGAGWVRHQVKGRSGSPPLAGPPSGADNDPDDYFSDAAVSDGGMRAEVRLRLGYLLRSGLYLGFGVALAAAFLDSPIIALALAQDKAEPLTATPWGVLRFGLGLRWNGL